MKPHVLERLFPSQIDRHFPGHPAALWLLVPLALVKLVQGANVVLAGRQVLESADRVPVSTFPAEAASHVVFLFGAWGLGISVLGLLAVVVLLRYRGMIPLMYLLLLIEQLGRKLLSTIHLDSPFFSARLSAPNIVNWTFLIAIVVGFLLSLRRDEDDRDARSGDSGRP